MCIENLKLEILHADVAAGGNANFCLHCDAFNTVSSAFSYASLNFVMLMKHCLRRRNK